ncbi:MAG: UDP-4-amino-4,6-dideoxy-N-acetyl-beta-L-altrosamine transaminase [Balneolaceae bacterium]|nr:UDP-4-amino-4,6-dideoxy-N-acetyl-beta-L-altrosamine transaminase [Balneolaceae bacterium]
MKFQIPYGRQHITSEDIQAVNGVLQSDYLTQGPEIQKFEEHFAEYTGSQYAVAVSNGTAALHLCAIALNVNKKSKVITTPITFAATANCIRYCGGDVFFADVHPESILLDVQKVRRILEGSPKGTYHGLIPVDFAGRAVNLEAYRKLADDYGLWIIEDACHAPGGYFTNSEGKKEKCGNGMYADLSIFSFHPVKHIAAGEGGMITTNNQELYEKLKRIRTHGITKNEQDFVNTRELAGGTEDVYPGWYMEMQELGFNYRLTDFQAALGSSQLSRADEGLKRRKEIAGVYAEAFRGKGFVKNNPDIVEGHAYHLYILEVENRLELYNELRRNGIYAQIHYIPLHLMPYYQKFGWKKGDFPHAEEYYSQCISLPIYPALSEDEQQYVIECIYRFYEI